MSVIAELSAQNRVMGLFVQYGCGLSAPDGWINFDVSPRLRFERLPIIGGLVSAAGNAIFPSNVKYGDIISGLPIDHHAADGVYCSHVLEHLDRESVVVALTNTLKILKPGGIFRMIVPDLEWRAKEYTTALQNGNVNSADEFIRACHIGLEKPVSGILGRLSAVYGNVNHRWMYDYVTMEKLLKKVGFIGIRRCVFGDSSTFEFTLVEDKGRFFERGFAELSIEAIAPSAEALGLQ